MFIFWKSKSLNFKEKEKKDYGRKNVSRRL